MTCSSRVISIHVFAFFTYESTLGQLSAHTASADCTIYGFGITSDLISVPVHSRRFYSSHDYPIFTIFFIIGLRYFYSIIVTPLQALQGGWKLAAGYLAAKKEKTDI